MRHFRAITAAALAAATSLACGNGSDRHDASSAPLSSARELTETTHAHHGARAAAETVSGGSLYQLRGRFTDQTGAAVELRVFEGHPVIVVMFYGTCEYACPTLVHDAERVLAALPAPARARTRVLLVTFDPEHDTTERLAAYAAERKLHAEQWRLLRGDPHQVRELAAALGVRYRPIGDGQFSHTMLLSLLDVCGEVVERVEGLGQPIDAFAGRLLSMVVERGA
jgi:protein SCO1/2